MAVFNTFTIDGENSLDYGVYISGEAVYNAPERAVEMVSIPGKNGALALDQGRFENIEVTYPAGTFGVKQTEFAGRMRAFRNMLASRYNYVRLTDSYHPDEYRLGLYKSGLEATPVAMSSAGEFDITFNCKPQRFLTSGEEPEDYVPGQAPADEQTKTGAIVTFEAEEDTIISDLVADIVPVQDLHGYDKPWAGGNGKNKLPPSTTRTISGITYTVADDGVVTLSGTATQEDILGIQFTVAETGNYYYNGCADGGNLSSTYDVFLWDATNGRRAYKWDGTTLNASITNSSQNEEVRLEVGITYQYRIRVRNGFVASGQKFYPMVRLSAESATYAPYSNICPISGWDEVKVTRSGFNALNPNADKIKGDYNLAIGAVLPSTSPTASASGTNPISVVVSNAWDLVTFISDELIANNTYTADYIITGSADNSKVRGTVYLIDDTYTVVEKIRNIQGSSGLKYTDVFTPSKTGLKFALAVSSSPAQTLTIEDLCVHLGEGEYEPYQATDTYTIDLDGTRYGGTLDVTSGVLTVDRGYVDIGSLAWIRSNTNRFQSTTLNGLIKSQNWRSLLCDIYSAFNPADTPITLYGITAFKDSGTDYLRVIDQNYDDATSFTNAVNGHQLVYELATPITVQLTPTEVKTLLGTNNIWADSGNVTVKYGTNPYLITNPTPFDALPLLKVTGTGVFGIGDCIITITGTAGQVIYIDCETMEIYKNTGGIITPAGNLVSFATNEFPKLPSGFSGVSLGDGITEVEITPRWWII